MNEKKYTECPDRERIISLLMDRRETGKEREMLEAHLSGCSLCSGYLSSMKESVDYMKKGLELSPVQLSSRFTSNVMSEIERPSGFWDDILAISVRTVGIIGIMVIFLIGIIIDRVNGDVSELGFDTWLELNGVDEEVLTLEEITKDDAVATALRGR